MASWKKVIVSGSSAELSTLSLDTALPVSSGGIGVNNLNSGGILFGNGTGAIQATTVLGNGQLLIGDGSGVPTIATLTAGEGIDITNGAGSITILGEDASTSNKGIVELATTAETTTGTSTTLAVTPSGLTNGYQGSTNVTTLGTIGTGVWNGTAIADAYVANDLTISGGTVDNTVIGGTSAAAGTFTGITLSSNGDITGTGSDIVLTGANSSLSGSFSGSFFGDGSGLSGVAVSFPSATATINSTLKYFVNDGASSQQTTQTALGTYMAGDGLASTNGILEVSAGTGLEIDSDAIRIASSAAGNGLTGGGGSALAVNTGTGLEINSDAVRISTAAAGTGLSGGGGSALSVDYGSTAGTAVQGNTSITVQGTANEIEVSGGSITLGSGGTATIGLPNDVTIGNDLTVTNDLGVTGNAVFENDIIVRGTASFENTENLEVADRFILLASGSTADGDGGIVIQTAADKTGKVFGWDGATSDRWSIATGFDPANSAFTPEAHMAAVVDIDAGQSDTSAYQKVGNIKVDNGDIFIYS